MARRNTREAWDVKPIPFEQLPSDRAKFEFLVRYAILAPSSHNTQPWRFRIGDDYIELLADKSRALPVIDYQNRQLIMSCGAALFNLRVAMRRFGWLDEVEFFPDHYDPNLLARVRRAERDYEPTRTELGMFDAIPMRHTNRKPFELRPVSHTIAEQLVRACAHERAWLVRLHPDAKYAAAELISQADRDQFADKDFRAELSEWLVSNSSQRGDGIPGYTKSYAAVTSYGTSALVRTFDIGKSVAATERDLAAGSPMLVVLGTTYDDSVAWLEGGQAMQRMLLTAQLYGLSASFLNQPLELDNYRPQFAALTEHDGFPQLIMRIGYGPAGPSTPRRRLEEVVETVDDSVENDVPGPALRLCPPIQG